MSENKNDDDAVSEATIPENVAAEILGKERRKANARHKKVAEFINEYTADGGDLDAPVHQLINWTYQKTLV